ncbi:hypothetical protein EBU71_12160 [bacterium]|nr:hypothetical protein [Candidatus Elulimicrobium humile]
MLTKTEHRFDAPINLDSSFSLLKTTVNQPTGNFFYDPWVIKPEFENTMLDRVLAALPRPIGEARLINLEPGTTYMAHADIDDRWHYTIQSQEGYLIDLSNKQMFLLETDGYWYEMDAGRIHVAANFGSINRLQLVVRKLLINTPITSLVKVTISPNKDLYDFRYRFDNVISPWLNSINKQGLMKDFMIKENSVSFKVVESELNTLNKNSDFKIVIE